MCNPTLDSTFDVSKCINVDLINKRLEFTSVASIFKSNWGYCHRVVDTLTQLTKQFCTSFNPSYIYSLSSILNELFENSVKFSLTDNSHFSLTLAIRDDSFHITSVNFSSDENYNKLLAINTKLSNFQQHDLFTAQLQSITAETSVSELGIISLYQYPYLQLDIAKSMVNGHLELLIEVTFTVHDCSHQSSENKGS